MALFPSKKVVITPATLLVVFLISSSSAQLSEEFYANSCPKLLDTVKSVVQSAIKKESRMGASLLRLHFHDCFVNGCDGSILLDDTPSFTGEKTAVPNNNSVRGFEVVDHIKTAVEKKCPGVVSCADILAIAARDSVVLLGGPVWTVKLGRRDAPNASLDGANKSIPRTNWTLQDTNSTFNALGLSTKDLVALSGAHTMRQDRKSNFGMSLDLQTPIKFNKEYYSKLDVTTIPCHGKFLEVEQTKSIVRTYSGNVSTFNNDFANAMIKMGDILPLAGLIKGEIRKNCRRAN